MSNIVKFPRATKPPVIKSVEPTPPTVGKVIDQSLLAGLVKFLWVTTVLVWPILKWILSIEVFFQFARMLYYWNTLGVIAGWTFLLHFAVLTAITYFVSIYKPKGL